jgi:Domain of unknown function (DUF927)
MIKKHLVEKPPAGILDAVVDQHGVHWIRFGTPEHSTIFSLPALQTNEKEVFARLSGAGTTYLTTESKNRFKALVEAHEEYRPALVAAHPGWLGGNYVFGDGFVERAPGDEREIIIGFEPRPKFTPKGTVQGWQEGVGPFVTGQPLALFSGAYGFVGPCLHFARPDLTNPEAEYVGQQESGKSTLLSLCCSVSSGDPNSDIGGAELWDRTIATIDIEKLAHADGTLGLDEGNLAGTDSRDQREVIKKAIFKLASTGNRKRYTDKSTVANVRLATLSTSNLPLSELIRAHKAVMGALHSRMCTIRVPEDSPHGVLASVPNGFRHSQDAMEALRANLDLNYGWPLRAFVEHLVKAAAQDEAGLRARIEKLMDHFEKELGRHGSARVKKTFAITFAAGVLARKWGILPKSWGLLLPALKQVYSMVEGAAEAKSSPRGEMSTARAMRRVRRYARRYRNELVRLRDIEGPYRPHVFDGARGFLQRVSGCDELLIPSRRFQKYFREPEDLARTLRSAGRMRTEGGKQPKLTIKAPRAICSGARVYCIRLR